MEMNKSTLLIIKNLRQDWSYNIWLIWAVTQMLYHLCEVLFHSVIQL